MRQIKIYDTTLRDGTQAEDFNLSLADKIRIAQKLAQLGIHYIEGGWPGSNPKDKDFFTEIRNYELGVSRIAAFGSTHHKDRPPEADPNMQELLISLAPVVTIFGKSSLFQVKEILQTTPERNLELITGSLGYLKPRVEELFYDAEHFFDAFKEDRDYALSTLEAALKGGAQYLVLCDTNGGTLTSELIEIVKAVQERFPEDAPGNPRPQRFGTGRGQLHRRGGTGMQPGPGDHQRRGRALRQRQPLLHHPQPPVEDGAGVPGPRPPEAAHRGLPVRL